MAIPSNSEPFSAIRVLGGVKNAGSGGNSGPGQFPLYKFKKGNREHRSDRAPLLRPTGGPRFPPRTIALLEFYLGGGAGRAAKSDRESGKAVQELLPRLAEKTLGAAAGDGAIAAACTIIKDAASAGAATATRGESVGDASEGVRSWATYGQRGRYYHAGGEHVGGSGRRQRWRCRQNSGGGEIQS